MVRKRRTEHTNVGQIGARASPTKSTGVTWVSSTGVTWSETDTTVDKLVKYSENIYGDGISAKQRNLIFTGEPKITVVDPNGDPEEEASARMTLMCRQVDLYAKMQSAGWYDPFWFGAGFLNDQWEWEGNEYILKDLVYLPAPSFKNRPNVTYKLCGSLLQGVILTPAGEIEYWQTQDELSLTPVKLDTDAVVMIKDPAQHDLAGKPTVKSVVKVIGMLDYVWIAQMQKCHKTGSPVHLIRIIGAKTSKQLGGQLSDVDYAKQYLKNWGKNAAFALRENFEVVDPQITDTSDNLETIDALNKMIIDRFSPSSFVAKDGTLIGGSSAPEADMMATYLAGIRARIETPFEAILQKKLDAELYEGYQVWIELPGMEVTNAEQDRANAETANNLQVAEPNELRELIGLKAKSEEELQAIKDYYAGKVVPVSTLPFGNLAEATAAKPSVKQVKRGLEDVIDDLANSVIQALPSDPVIHITKD